MIATKPKFRRTLSGKRIPLDAPRKPFWTELVQAPAPPTGGKQRTGEFYDRMRALPTPESLAVNEFPEDYRGGRLRRRSSVYTKRLHTYLGEEWTAKRMRRRAARLAEQARRVAKREAAA